MVYHNYILTLHFTLLNTRAVDGFRSNVNDLSGIASVSDDAIVKKANARIKNKTERATSNDGDGSVCGREVMDILCKYDCLRVIFGWILHILMDLMLIQMIMHDLNMILIKFGHSMLSFFVWCRVLLFLKILNIFC